MTKIRRWLSEAVMMESMEIWRRYARGMPRIEDTRAIRMMTQEIMIANDKQVNEQAEEDQKDQEDQEDQESGNGQTSTTDERSEDEKIIDLTDEIDTEPIKSEEADDKHCTRDKEEGQCKKRYKRQNYQSKMHPTLKI
jgi:hypothetical protein